MMACYLNLPLIFNVANLQYIFHNNYASVKQTEFITY